MGLKQFVSRLCRGKIESISVGAEQEEMLSAITEDPQGNLWLGGRWGNLFRLSPANFLSFTRREGLPESHLTGVAVDRDGAIWGSLKDSGLVRLADGAGGESRGRRSGSQFHRHIPGGSKRKPSTSN
jgi:ligand-binding sensor domain-containing protein